MEKHIVDKKPGFLTRWSEIIISLPGGRSGAKAYRYVGTSAFAVYKAT